MAERSLAHRVLPLTIPFTGPRQGEPVERGVVGDPDRVALDNDVQALVPPVAPGRLAIIGVLAGVYILPTVIGIARQVEGLGVVICLNAFPVGWPAALILACLMPRKQIR